MGVAGGVRASGGGGGGCEGGGERGGGGRGGGVVGGVRRGGMGRRRGEGGAGGGATGGGRQETGEGTPEGGDSPGELPQGCTQTVGTSCWKSSSLMVGYTYRTVSLRALNNLRQWSWHATLIRIVKHITVP